MARLGASITDYLGPVDPDEYLRECADQGYRSAPCPVIDPEDTEAAQYVRRQFARADVVISEVAAWVNPMDPDPRLRSQARDEITRSLALADELGAACCTTVSGSLASSDTPDSHVGHHPDNFTSDAVDAVIEWIRDVLGAVKPTRSFLTLEMCPWAIVDRPEVYRHILDRVDDPGLAVHIDPANSMVSPRALFNSGAVIEDLFDQLGQWTKACHAKDVTFVGSPSIVAMEEVPPGAGYLDYNAFLRCMTRLDSDIPLIMEHLPDRETYAQSAGRIRKVAAAHGVPL